MLGFCVFFAAVALNLRAETASSECLDEVGVQRMRHLAEGVPLLAKKRQRQLD